VDGWQVGNAARRSSLARRNFWVARDSRSVSVTVSQPRRLDELVDESVEKAAGRKKVSGPET
jgi:hypothetical protein